MRSNCTFTREEIESAARFWKWNLFCRQWAYVSRMMEGVAAQERTLWTQ